MNEEFCAEEGHLPAYMQDNFSLQHKLLCALSLIDNTMAIDPLAKADPLWAMVRVLVKDALKDFDMLTRPTYEREKERRLEDLNAELDAIEVRKTQIMQAISVLEQETFDEFLADARFDSWKAKREDMY